MREVTVRVITRVMFNSEDPGNEIYYELDELTELEDTGPLKIINGHIHILVNGQDLHESLGLWDELEIRWPFLIGTLQDLHRSGSAVDYWGNQGVQTAIERFDRGSEEWVALTVRLSRSGETIGETLYAPYLDYVEAMCRSGLTFLTRILELDATYEFQRDIEDFKRILQDHGLEPDNPSPRAQGPDDT